MPELIEIIWRLFLGAVLSGFIGFERETHGRAAGLRTHILVGTGSTLFTLVSIHMAVAYGFLGEVSVDRIAAQVVTGVGFLGAGTILRFGSSIRGLTTAASIWGVAAIGLAVGSGFYSGAVITSAIMLASLYWLSRIETAIPRHVKFKAVKMRGVNIERHLEKIKSVLEERKITIERLSWERDFLKKEMVSVDLFLRMKDSAVLMEAVKDLGSLEGMAEVSAE